MKPGYICLDVDLTSKMKKLSQDNAVRCMSDVSYLRTRNRWTQELEDELIELHLQGTPPNIYEFGVTKTKHR